MTIRAIAPTPPAMPVAAEPAASVELGALVRLAASLTPNWENPMKFHELKSELTMRLRQVHRHVALLEERAQREASR